MICTPSDGPPRLPPLWVFRGWWMEGRFRTGVTQTKSQRRLTSCGICPTRMNEKQVDAHTCTYCELKSHRISETIPQDAGYQAYTHLPGHAHVSRDSPDLGRDKKLPCKQYNSLWIKLSRADAVKLRSARVEEKRGSSTVRGQYRADGCSAPSPLGLRWVASRERKGRQI